MADTKSAPKSATYNVLSQLKHDGKLFRKGATIRLTDEEAAPLLQHKTIEPAK